MSGRGDIPSTHTGPIPGRKGLGGSREPGSPAFCPSDVRCPPSFPCLSAEPRSSGHSLLHFLAQVLAGVHACLPNLTAPVDSINGYLLTIPC